jgi:hypothetical protein
MDEGRYLEDILRPLTWRDRFKVAWFALRGHSIMWRVAVEFTHSPNFIGEHGHFTHCIFNSLDGSMPYMNGVPMREYIGKGNRWTGWGIWDDKEEKDG